MILRAPVLVAVWCATAATAAVRIAEASLHQFDDGPPLAATFAFAPGDPVWVIARFADYQRSKNEDHPRLHLTWQVEVLDPQGVPVVELKREKIDAELHPQDKNWMPKVRYDFMLPPLAGSGRYKAVLNVKDELSGATARREIEFRIQGHQVEPSAVLVARNLRFLRKEDDEQPLATPAFRPGDTVWARFDITGYKLGDGNRYEVAYGLEVLDAEGKTVFAQPEAAREKDQSFYPKRYVPGILSLNLTKDVPKGAYTIVLRLTDPLGNQTAESKHAFAVE